MLNLLNNIRIGKRIFLLVLAPVLGMAALAAIYFTGDQTVEAAFHANQVAFEAADTSDQMNITALQMRRKEKDFFLRNDDKSADEVKTQTETLHGLIKEMLDNPDYAEYAEPAAKLEALHERSEERRVGKECRL